MSARAMVIMVSVGLALAGALIAFLIPVPADWKTADLDFYWPIATSFTYTPLHIGAVVLFLMGLGAYKAKLRLAYALIVSGVIFTTLALAQIAVLSAFDLVDSAWVRRGGIMLPFMLTSLVSYIGVRSLTRQVGAQSILTKVTVAIAVVVGFIGITSLLPHAATDVPEKFFDIGNAILALHLSVNVMCVAMIFRISRHVGAHYTRAMAWLGVGFCGTVTVTLIALSAILMSSDIGFRVLGVAVIISGFIYIKAGHAFALTKEV